MILESSLCETFGCNVWITGRVQRERERAEKRVALGLRVFPGSPVAP